MAPSPRSARRWSAFRTTPKRTGCWRASTARCTAGRIVSTLQKRRQPSFRTPRCSATRSTRSALGDGAGAAQTDDLIRTVERIGNAQHVSDRLLAIYYSEHGEHLDDAYAIALRERNVRGDLFTDD